MRFDGAARRISLGKNSMDLCTARDAAAALLLFLVLPGIAHGRSSKRPDGHIAAEPDNGDDKEQHHERREDPGDGHRSHALAALGPATTGSIGTPALA